MFLLYVLFAMGQRIYFFIFKYVILCMIHDMMQAWQESVNCTFDGDFCEWTQNDDDTFDWKRDKGVPVSSPQIGPQSDHTSGKGFYIFIDATNQKRDDKARITSPIQTPGPHCFRFWYCMNGNNFGALKIHVQIVKGTESLVFSKNTKIGSHRWQKAVISLNTTHPFQVVLEGVRGSSIESDIAVDDISMTDGMCTVDCLFESGLCDWVQDLSDNFDWKTNQGGTNTRKTGPPGDHTSGNGYYIYIDTSESERGTNARLLSPWLSEGKYCFSFWYYMYGKHVKPLTVRTADVNLYENEIINIAVGKHQQQQRWIQANAFVHPESGFQFIIEGTVKDKENHDFGDIAIDDIRLLSCQDCADPTPSYGKANSTNFQYNSTVQIECNSGYTIRGDDVISCKAKGTWSGSPTCEPVHSVNSNSLTTVYVPVLLITVAFVIFIIIVFCSKKVMHMCLEVRERRAQPTSTFSNGQSNPDGLYEDTEYAVITDDRNNMGQDSHIDNVNAADDAITKIKKSDSTYNHTNTSRTPAFDSNYSHITGDKGRFAPNYDQASIQLSGNTLIQSNTNLKNKKYEVLNLQRPTDSLDPVEQPKKQVRTDSEYDHTQAAGSEPVVLDVYSHLDMGTEKSDPSSNVKKSTLNNDVKTEGMATNNACGQSVPTTEYFVLEPHSVDTGGNERHYFVLEKVDE